MSADAFEVSFTGFVAAGLFVDALDDAFVDGFLEGNGVQTPAHGIAAFGDVADELVEQCAVAAMGGNDGEPSGHSVICWD